MSFIKQILPVKLLTMTLGMAVLSSSLSIQAQSLAITNATVYTVTEQGVLNNATVIVEDGKITAINPSSVDADVTIDAKGKILTPGFIGSMNQLGLVEVGAVSRTRDASDKKADITFDASLAFNPKSTVIPYSRKGGITRNIVTPSGGESMFKGFAFTADLSGDFDSVIDSKSAVVIDLGAKSKGSRALELQALSQQLEDASKKLTDEESSKDDKKESLKRDEKIINSLLAGEIPLLAYADRATDLLTLINLKKEFNLNLIIAGAADGILVSKQLADENIVVVVSVMRNLPDSFDSLHTSLASAAELTQAGVKVILSVNDAHNIYQLRYDAGISVANGLSKDAALAAITRNVADTFSLNAGRIATGYDADLVLWSADPFELSTHVDKMWIAGEEVSTTSRQDALRKRYTTNSDMPRAYIK